MNNIPFINTYLELGDPFYVKTPPTPVTNPALIHFNQSLASELGLDVGDLDPADIAAVFSGNRMPDGAEPLATAYAGHQFGHFNPQLGDGRALLLGEVQAPDGHGYEIQLKGSGQTVFSRNGDGRAALGPVIREYLLSEAMYRLGVPTTRALAAVTTGEEVARENLIPGGVITRTARSFVRIGTFQFFAARGDTESVQKLADHMIERSYPSARDSNQPYTAFFKGVVDRQAALIARWMHLGFIHGVMNTDNMSIAGETIDYGPCAFMDYFNHNQVYSSIDHGGRYAYNNQPAIALWNLTRLAESLLPLFSENSETAVQIAQDILEGFIEAYQAKWLSGMQEKLGLTHESDKQENDKDLIEDLLDIMADNDADFTLTFHYLSRISTDPSAQDDKIRGLLSSPRALDSWLEKWRKRLSSESSSDDLRQANMQKTNPVYIPRNHQIEAAIRAAEDHGDFSVFHSLHEVLETPYQQKQGKDQYMLPPQPDEIVWKTFCGT